MVLFLDMILVGYGQELHHSFREFGNCGELQYLTMLVPLKETNCSCFSKVLNKYELGCRPPAPLATNYIFLAMLNILYSPQYSDNVCFHQKCQFSIFVIGCIG